MPALNFKSQFADKIMAGMTPAERHYSYSGDDYPKRQTIRRLRKDGRDPKPGDRLHLYTGLRTAHCRRLGWVDCKWVLDIEILAGSRLCKLNGEHRQQYLDFLKRKYPGLDPKDGLAREDGFHNWAELAEWFDLINGPLPFTGKLIVW